ncbi:hypothetical protein BP00DRAFT_415287 [Aspergillus indologenus CBS 114.80]|uniref:Uncharacterized protein n=1 Tax=Aspergillus indologenus CBS 114.80 TaxID=1450541 RepID=A0A2V5I4Y1_9EURO|nr:hypothetical protein BP00DRAFT_415287 [Aspergillus indologenus CBS 114.80]
MSVSTCPCCSGAKLVPSAEPALDTAALEMFAWKMARLEFTIHVGFTSWRMVKGGSPIFHALGIDRDILGFMDLVQFTLYRILRQEELRAKREKDVDYERGLYYWDAKAGSVHRHQLECISHHWGYYRGMMHEMLTEGVHKLLLETTWCGQPWARPDWKAYAIVWCVPQLRDMLSVITSPEAHSTMRAAVHRYLDPAAVSRLDERRPPVYRFDRPLMKLTQPEDSICGICLEELEPESGELVWCKPQCGTTFHNLYGGKCHLAQTVRLCGLPFVGPASVRVHAGKVTQKMIQTRKMIQTQNECKIEILIPRGIHTSTSIAIELSDPRCYFTSIEHDLGNRCDSLGSMDVWVIPGSQGETSYKVAKVMNTDYVRLSVNHQGHRSGRTVGGSLATEAAGPPTISLGDHVVFWD